MIIKKGDLYTLCIDPFPWSDDFAHLHSTIESTLLTKDQARKLLDGQSIEIVDPDPDQHPFYKGDLKVAGKWVKGYLKSGSLAGSAVAVLDIWLGTGSCNCDITTLMAGGCQCGGS